MARLRKHIINAIKVAASAAILAWLVRSASADKAFADLRDQPKDWSALAAAWACIFGSVVLSIVRWYLLVRALELPFRLRDALRLGFLGYLLNFVSLGNVGGDLFKAVFIAREQPGRRAEAVATVFVDRLLGLYVLFLVASVAVLATGQLSSPVREVRVLCQATLACTVVGALCIVVLLWPGFTNGWLSEALANVPKLGSVFESLIGAVRMYRRRIGTLLAACLLTVGVHAGTTVGVYLIARGLPGEAPTLGAHFIIVPLAMLAGAVPLLPSGLGAFEGALDLLYRAMADGRNVVAGEGLLVALGYRVITLTIAGVGIAFWIAGRREVSAVLHERESLGAEVVEDLSPRQQPQGANR